MKRIVRIVTSHVRSERDTVVDSWKADGVAAIGFGRTGDLRGLSKDEIRHRVAREYPTRYRPGTRERIVRTKRSINRVVNDLLWFRDEVVPPALIFAYQTQNCVALVGDVTERYDYNANNRVGSHSALWKDYQHQVDVKWWDKPPRFHREVLSETILPELVRWIGRTGTIYFKDFEDTQVETLKSQLLEIPGDCG